MRKILLNLGFTLLSLITYSQNFIDTIVWEAHAKSGGKFIGIANDEFHAEEIIDEIQFDNEGTKYEIVSFNMNEASINLNSDITTVADDFISEHDALEYKYISEIELIALEYIEDGDYKTGATFYKNVSREKNEEKIKKYLEVLHKNYSKYLFNTQSPAMLVSFSE